MTLHAAIARLNIYSACIHTAGFLRRQRCWRLFGSNIDPSKVEKRYGKLQAYIIAGEPSGDVIGGNLIESLKRMSGGDIVVSGVGGERMRRAGLRKSAVSFDDIAVMGTVELVSKLYKLHKSVNRVVDHLIETKPDVIVAIDAKGFNKAVLKRYLKRAYGNPDRAAAQSANKLQARPPPTIQYVAPSYWAYKSSSKDKPKELLAYFEKAYCILPFETHALEACSVPNLFVGHPAVEEMVNLFDSHDVSGGGINYLDSLRQSITRRRPSAREQFGISSCSGYDEKVLLLFPGSRMQEVEKSLPLLFDMLKSFSQDHGGSLENNQSETTPWTILVPSLSKNTAVGQKVFEFVNKCNNSNVLSPYVKTVMYIDNDSIDMKRDAFAAADVAIAMSGTVVTELALANVKTLVIYPGSYLTGAIAKRLAKVNSVSIPNILAGETLIDELLFDDCNVESLTVKARELLATYGGLDRQSNGGGSTNDPLLDSSLLSLLNNGSIPSEVAAIDILKLAKEYQKSLLRNME